MTEPSSEQWGAACWVSGFLGPTFCVAPWEALDLLDRYGLNESRLPQPEVALARLEEASRAGR